MSGQALSPLNQGPTLTRSRGCLHEVEMRPTPVPPRDEPAERGLRLALSRPPVVDELERDARAY